MKILLVEDSELMRLIISRDIRMVFDSAIVVHANDGLEALDVLQRDSTIEFVLSDSNMPNMSGLELLTQLRQTGNRIPFGFFTSQASQAFVQAAKQLGVAFVHPKPFSPKHLMADIENAIENRE